MSSRKPNLRNFPEMRDLIDYWRTEFVTQKNAELLETSSPGVNQVNWVSVKFSAAIASLSLAPPEERPKEIKVLHDNCPMTAMLLRQYPFITVNILTNSFFSSVAFLGEFSVILNSEDVLDWYNDTAKLRPLQ